MFADDTWPGAVALCDYFSARPDLVRDKRILELGAGAALPSLVCCKLDAQFVLITDYPDTDILQNIEYLLSVNSLSSRAAVMGYSWGDSVTTLLGAPHTNESTSQLYDVVIMAELLWRDTYPLHRKLIISAHECLTPGGVAYVSFAKRPVDSSDGLQKHNDDDFFAHAVDIGFDVKHLECVQKNDVCSKDIVEVLILSLTKL